jgi:hypothetical protein
MNPADLASRGCKAADLMESGLWWTGPGFVREDPARWPQAVVSTEVEVGLEKSETKPITPKVNVLQLQRDLVDEIIHRFESWEKFLRFSAFILRFGLPEHKGYRGKSITTTELQAVELWWMRKAQQSSFQEELQKVQSSGQDQERFVPIQVGKSSTIKDLNPVFDVQRNMIVSQTRLVLMDLPEETKRPIILPKDSNIVEKYVLFLHKIHGHAGPEYVRSLLRTKYHLCHSRRQVRKFLRKCTAKKCTKPRLLTQQMAPLPKERGDDPQCFKNTAVDLFGPLFVKHSCELTNCPHEPTSKVYGCLYTCFHSRAVHLELLKDASTEDFLLGFRSFVSRRGCPQLVYSDHGRNFVKASKEIRSLFRSINWKSVESQTHSKGIQWVFSVEKAPWMNGLCERMVASVKRPLRIILGQSNLTFRHLQIIMAEVGSLINNRPLCAMGENPDEMIPLTPAELLMGRRMEAPLPDPNFRAKDAQHLDFTGMWRKRQLLLNQFWRKWRDSYLQNLSIRQKWREPQEENLMDKIVLIRDDNLSRNEWKMGKIIQVFPSRDGLIRSVQLKTATGSLRRPIQKLAILESVF